MKLYKLAFACYIYGSFTDYDKSYIDFLNKTDFSLELSKKEHRKALLKWLNQWGCRQFALNYHEEASEEIKEWFENYSTILPNKKRYIWELTDVQIDSFKDAYISLSNKIASQRKRSGYSYSVTIGPTGAAKILFALRPRIFVPWDDPIRKELKFTTGASSYMSYLKLIKSELEELKIQCNRFGLNLIDLPKKLRRDYSTTPKLVDEYYWVTITNKCQPPDIKILKKWLDWVV